MGCSLLRFAICWPSWWFTRYVALIPTLHEYYVWSNCSHNSVLGLHHKRRPRILCRYQAQHMGSEGTSPGRRPTNGLVFPRQQLRICIKHVPTSELNLRRSQLLTYLSYIHFCHLISISHLPFKHVCLFHFIWFRAWRETMFLMFGVHLIEFLFYSMLILGFEEMDFWRFVPFFGNHLR